MTRVPSPPECRRILQESGTPADVVAHAEAVERVAAPIALRLEQLGQAIDVDLVVAGALLHDIGRSRTHGLDHAGVGADLLRQRGLPEALCLVVERHTGGGIDADEARQLGLPARDYTPRSIEERVVCAADNLVDGTRRQKVQEELDHLRARGLLEVAAKIERLHQDLSDLARRNLDGIV